MKKVLKILLSVMLLCTFLVPFTACSGAGMWCVMQDADTCEYVTVGE